MKYNEDIIKHIQLRYKNIINKNIDFIKGVHQELMINAAMAQVLVYFWHEV
jgi:hypothetical protein